MSEHELLARIRVVLCRPRHPGNIGAVARAMKTMGLNRLYMVTPERMVAGLPDSEAEARASGASDVLAAAVFCESLDAALAGVAHVAAVTARRRDIGPPGGDAREIAAILVAAAANSDVALVFGNETSGLSNEEVMRCDWCVTIPTNPDFSSLNLAAAAQVLAYELRMAVLTLGGGALVAGAARGGRSLSDEVAPREDVERLFEHLERTMTATGFLNPEQPRRLMPKLRRMFGRTALERDEINILRGFLSSVEDRREK